MFVYTKENGIQELIQDVKELSWFDAMIYRADESFDKLRIRPKQVTQIPVKQVDCDNGKHDMKQHWTGSDCLFMACKYCDVQYDINTDPAGDFSGASEDEWGGR